MAAIEAGELAALGGEAYCYLVTTGRRSGEPREVEIWFAIEGTVLYMLAGGREGAHWVRNIQQEPAVTVRIGERTFAGRGRVLGEGAEDARARELLFAKYSAGYSSDLTGWRQTALPVAVDLLEMV